MLLILLIIGMPIGFTLLIVGSLGIFIEGGWVSLNGLLSGISFSTVNDFNLTTIPLFILMAHFISNSNLAKDIYNALLKWFGHIPGGIGISTVIASAGLGALSGSSVASTSVMSKISIPELVKAGYKGSFAAGLVATATGTLAVMIPPSVPLIFYGVLTETSIGKLLIAGIVPGIMIAIFLSLLITFMSLRMDNKVQKASWRSRWVSLTSIWPMMLLVLFVIGSIYMGIATATESAALGATGALIIGLLLKRLNIKSIISSVIKTTEQTAMIFIIIIGGYTFAYFMTMTGVGQSIINTISQSSLPSGVILIMIIILYLILGLFMDMAGALILTLPLVHPIIVELGFSEIWFGVLVVLLVEIGLVTPPVGINLFITSEYSKVPVKQVFYGSIPFILVLLLAVIILSIFPQI